MWQGRHVSGSAVGGACRALSIAAAAD